jgi:hypothetical protein
MGQFAIIAEHSPDLCPSANAKVRKLLAEGAAQIPALAEKLGIKIVTLNALGPEHLILGVMEADDIETVRDFVMQSGLVQWNTVRVNATWTLEEAMAKSASLEPIF